MTTYGCQITPGCWDDDDDPNPPADGYWMGSTVTPEACFSPTGVGISDRDRDGMDDTCERLLAERFRPELRLSSYDCDTGREPYWAVKYFPNHGKVVRIAYLLSYYVDCGVQEPTFTCFVLDAGVRIARVIPPVSGAVLVGLLPVSPEDFCGGHVGDSEFMTIDVGYNDGTEHWVLQSVFLSAHFGSVGDASTTASYGKLQYPDRNRGYPVVWVADGKHANYASRAACSNRATETCDGNPDSGSRLEFVGARNIGSVQENLISYESCVPGGRLYQTYPDQYGIECFWRGGEWFRFSGWASVQAPEDASPYRTPLVLKFECFSYTVSGNDASCSDMGVQR
jgi:hypothetical protein